MDNKDTKLNKFEIGGIICTAIGAAASILGMIFGVKNPRKK